MTFAVAAAAAAVVVVVAVVAEALFQSRHQRFGCSQAVSFVQM